MLYTGTCAGLPEAPEPDLSRKSPIRTHAQLVQPQLVSSRALAMPIREKILPGTVRMTSSFGNLYLFFRCPHDITRLHSFEVDCEVVLEGMITVSDCFDDRTSL